MIKKRQNNRGFTLIETLVSLAVFGIVITIATGAFTNGLKAQRRSLALQEAQNDLRYAIETMAREIRMSHINSTDGLHSDFLDIILHQTDRHVYYQHISGAIGLIVRSATPITSSKVDVTDLNFYVQGQASSPATVTIVIKAKTTGAYAGQEINLQTTVSTRDYE